jgi:hypothetical protein
MIGNALPTAVMLYLLIVGTANAQTQNLGVFEGFDLGISNTARSSNFYNSTGDYLGRSIQSDGSTRYYDDVGNYLGRSIDLPQTPYQGHRLLRPGFGR